MTEKASSVIVTFVSRFLAPFIQLFALYVVFHGHYSPGGGFQGGAMLAASVILIRLSLGSRIGELQLPKRVTGSVSSTGGLVYLGVGVLALVMGGRYLEYRYLPLFGLEPEALRSLGILFVEIGVAVALTGTLVIIFDSLMEGENRG